jgi:diguanylate cyclase (GGDEF)-like protein/PAS domain S-box-containing protein
MLVSVIGIASWLIQNTIETNTRKEIYNFLTAELNSTHQSVKYWLQEHQAATKVWANTREVRNAALELLASKPNKDRLVNAPAQTLLRTWLRPVHVGKGYHGYFIISPDLQNLASSRDANIGTKSLLSGQGKFFARILSGHTAVSSPELSDVPLPDKQGNLRPKLPTMFVGAPIFDTDGTVIAIFTFRLNYSSIFTNLLQHAHIGETGETFAFDRHGRLISESRFEEQLRDLGLLTAGESSILNIRLTDPVIDLNRGGKSTIATAQQSLNRMAGSATQGQSGIDLDGYRDYRGVAVVGAWHWDPELDFGFTSELDVSEAYKTFYTTRNTIIALSMLAMLMAVLLALIYYIYQQRKLAEQALRDSNQYNRMLFEESTSGLALCRMSGELVDINQSFASILGRSIETTLDLSYWEITPEKYAAEEQHQLDSLQKTGRYGPYQKEYIHKDGHLVPVELNGQILEKDGEKFIWSTVDDITQRKQAEDELRQAATVFDNTDEGIIVTDAEQNIITVNKAFTVITGYQRREVLGKNPSFHQSGRHDSAFYHAMWNTIDSKGQWRGEIWNQRKSGEIYPVWENINAVKDNQGRIINYVSVFTDISSIKESEAQLAHIAHHDTLTGLPNRLLFSATLEQAFEHANRHKHKVAVLFLDLDRFKVINDTMGHTNGDKLLQAVANRLTDCVRAEDTVARLGGDEFTVILYEITQAQDAANIAEKIIDVVSQPIMIDGHELITSTSIGISLYPDDATNYTDLVKAADTAMYHAKERGRKNFQFYTQELTQKAFEHLSIERGLHRALDNGELELYYQPQVNLHNGHIVGVEALARWHHPERGLLLPDVFIPIAEESTLIDPISEWVLRTAYADLLAWKSAGLPAVRMAVNISPRQLSTQRNINKIHAVLEEFEFDTHTFQIDLEITESVLELAEDSIETIGQLKKHNVMLAIDDFGTGHSSLSRLKDLPIDTIKIDQSFINGLPDDPDNQAIVSAIIAMAHSLKLTVIAEGVETREQMLFLCGLKCDEMQGFLFSEALPASEIPAILKQAASNYCE